jgi:hypothetical protein
MKKTLLLILLLFNIAAIAQKKDKIKGNKNVTFEDRTFDYFSKIEVNDKIKLTLKQDGSTRLTIEADDNLHDVIDSEIEDGTLVLSLNKRITSSKRLNITLYIEDLDVLELNDDSEIKALDRFNFFDIHVILNDKSDIKIDIESQIVSLESNEKSKGSFIIKADSISLHMKESSKIKYVIDTKKLDVNYDGSATGEFVGKVTNLILNAHDNASFRGYELVAQEVSINASNNSSSYVNSKNNLSISAKDKSKIYVFNSPTIELKIFEDTASIFKRESMKLLEKL